MTTTRRSLLRLKRRLTGRTRRTRVMRMSKQSKLKTKTKTKMKKMRIRKARRSHLSMTAAM